MISAGTRAIHMRQRSLVFLILIATWFCLRRDQPTPILHCTLWIERIGQPREHLEGGSRGSVRWLWRTPIIDISTTPSCGEVGGGSRGFVTTNSPVHRTLLAPSCNISIVRGYLMRLLPRSGGCGQRCSQAGGCFVQQIPSPDQTKQDARRMQALAAYMIEDVATNHRAFSLPTVFWAGWDRCALVVMSDSASSLTVASALMNHRREQRVLERRSPLFASLCMCFGHAAMTSLHPSLHRIIREVEKWTHIFEHGPDNAIIWLVSCPPLHPGIFP